MAKYSFFYIILMTVLIFTIGCPPEEAESVEIKNEPGLLTLIGRAGVMHYTTPNPTDEPRISMAFDLCRVPEMNNGTLNRHTFIPLL